MERFENESAVVYRGIGDIRQEDVPRPQIQEPENAIVRVTTASICGSDLHILYGHLGLEPGTIVYHEFTSVVEEVGSAVSQVLITEAASCSAVISY